MTTKRRKSLDEQALERAVGALRRVYRQRYPLCNRDRDQLLATMIAALNAEFRPSPAKELP